MDDHDDELAEAIRELTRTIDELRSELDDSRQRSPVRGPTPRPPTPREFLRLADEVALPALLAGLEASIRALEAFQRGLTIVRTEREVRDTVRDRDITTQRASDRARDLRQSTLSQLDTVLEQLQRAASEGSLPADEDARSLLSEARKLRNDVDARLQQVADDEEHDTTEISIDGPDADADGDESDDDETGVDVDAELRTLKDRYADEDQPTASPADTGDETAADDDDDDDDQTGSNR